MPTRNGERGGLHAPSKAVPHMAANKRLRCALRSAHPQDVDGSTKLPMNILRLKNTQEIG